MTLRRYDLVNAGEISAGLTPYSSHILPWQAARQGSNPPLSDRTLFNALIKPSFAQLATSELVGFYCDLRSLAELVSSGSSLLFTLHHCMRSLCPPGSPLYTVLHTLSEGPTLDLAAVLSYLGAIFWDLYFGACGVLIDVDFIQHYFRRLRAFISRQGLNRTPSLHVFLWVLMTDADTLSLESLERVWLTGRLLWVLRRLGMSLRQRIEEVLLGFLFGDEFGTDGAFIWDPEGFEREIFGNLKKEGVL